MCSSRLLAGRYIILDKTSGISLKQQICQSPASLYKTSCLLGFSESANECTIIHCQTTRSFLSQQRLSWLSKDPGGLPTIQTATDRFPSKEILKATKSNPRISRRAQPTTFWRRYLRSLWKGNPASRSKAPVNLCLTLPKQPLSNLPRAARPPSNPAAVHYGACLVSTMPCLAVQRWLVPLANYSWAASTRGYNICWRGK